MTSGEEKIWNKNPPLAAWDLVCRPKDQGGLGIINLQARNDAFLIKIYFKLINIKAIHWVHLIWESYYSQGMPPTQYVDCSFLWKDRLKLLPIFKGNASCQVKDHAYASIFWKDKWEGIPVQEVWTHLFSFVRNENSSVKEILQHSPPEDLFLPLSIEAFEETTNLNELIFGHTSLT